MKTILIQQREPTLKEMEENDAEVVFIREDRLGKQYTIYGAVCYESWEQWGASADILSDNVETIEEWREGVDVEEDDDEERTWSSNGNIWNDGDIPTCEYCNKTIDEVGSLHETPYSGEVCCDDQECRETLLNNVLCEEVTED